MKVRMFTQKSRANIFLMLTQSRMKGDKTILKKGVLKHFAKFTGKHLC